MPGTMVKIFCKVGQTVKKGEALFSVDSMKMEYMTRATHDVKIKEIRVGEKQLVKMGDRIIIFEEE